MPLGGLVPEPPEPPLPAPPDPDPSGGVHYHLVSTAKIIK